MNTIALQPTQKIPRRYPTTKKIVQNSEKVLSDREKTLLDIKYFKKYVEDLRAGRPVDNLSPSNDPYFLIPENIEDLIQSMEDKLQGKGRVIKSVEDVWKNLDIE